LGTGKICGDTELGFFKLGEAMGVFRERGAHHHPETTEQRGGKKEGTGENKHSISPGLKGRLSFLRDYDGPSKGKGGSPSGGSIREDSKKKNEEKSVKGREGFPLVRIVNGRMRGEAGPWSLDWGEL